MTPALTIAQQLWALYQARRWREARELFAPDAICDWPATCERYTGAEAIVHVNAVYPEGWTIHLLDAQPLPDGRALTLVRVDQAGQSFYATSFFTVTDGHITGLIEYWADTQTPPAWREGLPGRSLLPP
ncbi:MAG: nuclear transport factor 2 family protein [Proteobacteria bacterium]|nr:nuclear transport factor 2 family protein [Pseudomonadota bacterium]